ncbi:hypothetical protein [Xanthomonas axonopodis]|nr:hypothetical protein [Xanthomonas axonopodis]
MSTASRRRRAMPWQSHIVQRRPVPSEAREYDGVGAACALLANTGVGLG